MDADGFALLTLMGYLAVAVLLVARSVIRCADGPGVWLLYVIERLYVPLMFRWRSTNGPSPLPSSGGGLVIANHRSPVDPMMVWMNHHLRRSAGDRAVRVIGFLTAREYCNPPGLGWLVRTMQSIPVDRNGQDTAPAREAIRRLRAGRLVGIFPEGGINTETDLRPPNTGVAFLALKAHVPVYPVFIHGTEFSAESGMVAPFVRRQTVRVTYGEAIDLSEFYGRRASPETLLQVANLLMVRLADLGGVGFVPAEVPVETALTTTAAGATTSSAATATATTETVTTTTATNATASDTDGCLPVSTDSTDSTDSAPDAHDVTEPSRQSRT